MAGSKPEVAIEGREESSKLTGPFHTSLTNNAYVTSATGLEHFLKNVECKTDSTVVVSIGMDDSFCQSTAQKIREIDVSWNYVTVIGVRDEPDTYLLTHLQRVISECGKVVPSRVVFHCVQGQSRSVFLLAALLILSYKSSPRDGDEYQLGDYVTLSLKTIREKGRSISINPGFVMQLLLVESGALDRVGAVKGPAESLSCAGNSETAPKKHTVSAKRGENTVICRKCGATQGQDPNVGVTVPAVVLRYDTAPLVREVCDEFWRAYRSPVMDRAQKRRKKREQEENKKGLGGKRKRAALSGSSASSCGNDDTDFVPMVTPVARNINDSFFLVALPPETLPCGKVGIICPGCTGVVGWSKGRGLVLGGYLSCDVAAYDRALVKVVKTL